MSSRSTTLTLARKHRNRATLPSSLTGADLLILARERGFGRNIDISAVERAYATRRRRVRTG